MHLSIIAPKRLPLKGYSIFIFYFFSHSQKKITYCAIPHWVFITILRLKQTLVKVLIYIRITLLISHISSTILIHSIARKSVDQIYLKSDSSFYVTKLKENI